MHVRRTFTRAALDQIEEGKKMIQEMGVPASLEASQDTARQMRERSAQATGATVSEPKEYEVIGRALSPAGAAS